MRCTIFCDIDGTIIKQLKTLSQMINNKDLTVLKDVREKFDEWMEKDYKIIITTARPESSRKQTEDQLRSCGLFWHVLLMDCPSGPRVVINDIRPKDGLHRAIGINVDRNVGFANVDIEKEIANVSTH
jgi:hypothetical protein